MKYFLKYYSKFEFSENSEMKDFLRDFSIPDDLKSDDIYISSEITNISEKMKYSTNVHIDYKNNGLSYDIEEALQLSDKLSNWELSQRASYFDIRIENSYDSQ